ncbi:ammonium transporter [Methanosarcina sp.]|uniref:ammonium transporter n=1 Tax=Methanosarcina sp. TaxID=2213 RepID=UPI002988B916|nr:ammonium transporter [Methanosarcina sp.]MDW5550859.1 ammonium transporter [Methanosarcina sp.]MDW5554681.1 ammonium transporter [Methanosarcina sp.]MDW5560468.1 ammonium transporter [Methanosarcina sp.]
MLKKMEKLNRLPIVTFVLLIALVSPAFAVTADENAAEIEEVKTTLTFMWLLLASGLVFFMHAGFSLVETGLTRSKNTANILMKNFMTVILGILVYWAVGWGIMYGADVAGIIGTNQFFLAGADNAIWNSWFFQMVFAATGATIVSGAMAERTNFKTYLVYCVMMVAVIYPIYGHWVWSGADMALLSGADSPIVKAIGVASHDFAGSGVVHSIGGYSALAGVLLVGARIGRFKDGKPVPIPGHNLTITFLGTLILALGWLGFNGGSTLNANDPYMNLVVVNTFLAGAAGALTVMIITWIKTGKPDPSLTANGLLGGLVAVTAPCGSISNWAALTIGLVAGIIIYAGVMFNENKLKLDDPVGAIAVHGYCGSWGLISVGLFSIGIGNGILADASYAAQAPGLFYGGGISLLLIQLVSVLVTMIWGFGLSYIIFKILDAVIGLRVSEEEEIAGLDISEHGIRAYPEYLMRED